MNALRANRARMPMIFPKHDVQTNQAEAEKEEFLDQLITKPEDASRKFTDAYKES